MATEPVNRQRDRTSAPTTRKSGEGEQEPSHLALLSVSEPSPRSAMRRFIRRFRRHRLGVLGVGLLLALVMMAIFAPLVAGQDPYLANLRSVNTPPSPAHILGTDAIGRDTWARLVYGARVSLSVGLVAVAIYVTIGVILGGISGYFGGRVDMLIMRFTDVVMCFPSFMLIITVAAILPPNIFNIMVIIGIFGWTGVCRLVRGQFLSLRETDFVLAARAVGVPSLRIVFSHIFPNTIAPVAVAATLGLSGAILAEAGLSFLGLGVQEPMSSWGSMLQTAMALPILQHMPWRWLPPAIAISLTVLAVNFAGDGLRDALDPRASLD